MRKRAKVDYRETAETIDSTSDWKRQTSASLKIETVDCILQDMFSDASIKVEVCFSHSGKMVSGWLM